jgi:hypothetical protein
MGIREKVNEKPGIAVAVVAIIALLAVFLVYRTFSGPAVPKADPAAQAAAPAYFTTDDGQTTFTDSSTSVAPFDHDGKQAVKAYMFNVNGKQVVGYLEKYSAGAGSPLMVKKPGVGGTWVPDSDPQAQAIRNAVSGSVMQAPNN